MGTIKIEEHDIQTLEEEVGDINRKAIVQRIHYTAVN